MQFYLSSIFDIFESILSFVHWSPDFLHQLRIFISSVPSRYKDVSSPATWRAVSLHSVINTFMVQRCIISRNLVGCFMVKAWLCTQWFTPGFVSVNPHACLVNPHDSLANAETFTAHLTVILYALFEFTESRQFHAEKPFCTWSHVTANAQTPRNCFGNIFNENLVQIFRGQNTRKSLYPYGIAS